jgi:hypothetical protein
LARIVLDHADLDGADYSNRRLVQFAASGSRLLRCRFDNTRIDDAVFGAGRETTEYIECSFDRARIRAGPGGYCRFTRCSFREVELVDWTCFAVELVECSFSGIVRNVIFNGTVPPEHRPYLGRVRNEFRGNDFSGADLLGVAFRTGIDLGAQVLPLGPPYLYLPEAAASVARAAETVRAWPDQDAARVASTVVRALEHELAGGQRQLLLRQDTYSPPLPADVVARLFEVLKSG